MKLLNSHQIYDFKELFKEFDEDGNDTIDPTELGELLSMLGFKTEHDQIMNVLRSFDQDRSGI